MKIIQASSKPCTLKSLRGAMTLQSVVVLFFFWVTVWVGYCTVPMYYDAYEIVQRIHLENVERPFELRDQEVIEAATRLLIAYKSHAPVEIQSIQVIKSDAQVQIAIQYRMKRHFIGHISFVAEFFELLQFPSTHAHP